MAAPNLALLFIRPLNKLGVPYMVTGSVATMVYGEPRLTMDVDLVLFLSRKDIPRFTEAFPLEEFYCPPAEILGAEIARERRGHFMLLHHETGFKADVYAGGSDPLQAWAMANAQRKQLEGEPMMVAPPEYVILKKLEFFREGGSEKHLRDIRSMFMVGTELAHAEYLQQLIAERGLHGAWAKVKEGIG